MPTPPDTTPAPAARRRGAALPWLAAALLPLAVAAAGWQLWQREQARAHAAAGAERLRIEALEARADALRNDQRAQTARLQQAEATNRLLRDELLGYGQRAALIEEHIQRLADPERSGAQALRLDEVELLLAQGQQRLLLAGDLDGARRAYALAGQLLEGIADPAWFNLRQALAQERSALEALGDDPKAVAAGRLEAFAAALSALPAQSPATAPAPAGWWLRAVSRVVEVRPTERAVAEQPADRIAGLSALRLELTLAQAAVERRDTDGFHAALARAEPWLPRLWPDSAERRALDARLAQLRGLPLDVDLPALGSTLAQLRQQRSR